MRRKSPSVDPWFSLQGPWVKQIYTGCLKKGGLVIQMSVKSLFFVTEPCVSPFFNDISL